MPQIGRNSDTMCSIGALARAVGGLGDLARATQLLDESLRIAHQLGDPHSIAEGFKDLGRTALLGGDPDRAIAMLCRAVPSIKSWLPISGARSVCTTWRARGSSGRRGRGSTPNRMGAGARTIARVASRRLHDSSPPQVPARDPRDRPPPELQVQVRADLATVRDMIGDAAFARAWADGRALSFEVAVGYRCPSWRRPSRLLPTRQPRRTDPLSMLTWHGSRPASEKSRSWLRGGERTARSRHILISPSERSTRTYGTSWASWTSRRAPSLPSG